ncbi:hypothetical protein PV326_011226 [Microctonus aethiopoides]|nr:hypothetical protein PV326_011226 [Microctonus aethiopoides]
MPSAAYNISNREEDKIRGRDQSFRNCIVTMFVFIMICVLIIVATIPWRNANARNNRDQDWSDSRTEKQFITTEGIKSTLNYHEISSTKSPQTTIISSTVKTSTATTIDEKTESKTTTQSIDIKPSDKYGLTTRQFLPSSTTIRNQNNAEVSTSKFDEKNEFKTTNRHYIAPLYTATIRNDIEMTSEKGKHTFDVSSTAIDEETKFKTTNQYVKRLSTTTIRNNIEKQFSRTMPDNIVSISSPNMFVPSSTTISPQIETSEIISSTDDSRTFSSDTSTQSSVKVKSSSFSSSIRPELSITKQDGFFYTEEREGSTDVSLTESTFDYSSSTEQLIISNGDENSTSLKRLVIRIYSGNESYTSENETDLSWVDDAISSIPSYQKNSNDELKNDSSTNSSGMTESYYDITTENFSSTESQIASITLAPSDENQNGTTIMTYKDENLIQSTTNILNQFVDDFSEENDSIPIDNVCHSGQCKQFSSKILSFMNHSADPCEDFYEYACGGMEADPHMNNINLADEAFDRIKSGLKKSKTNQKHPAFFKDYYNSCIQYYEKITQDKKIQQAKQMLAKIGQFYTASDWPNNSYPGITKLIANMIIYNSPLLFDIVPDVNEIDPGKFILRLGPISDRQNLFPNFEENSCITQTDEILSDDIDMEKQYKYYKNCRNNEQQSRNIISKALKAFDIFNHINNTLNKFEHMEKIAIDIDNRIIKVFSNYSSSSEIYTAYKSKNYSIITLGALEVQSKFINWTELIHTITGVQLTPNTELQVYFEDQLIRALKSLEKFHELYELNNALLGLYAKNLYEQFIEPKTFGDLEKQCLHIAMNYLPNEASQLYLSSFTKMQIDLMNATMYKVFADLKETLKLKFERAQWATQAGRNELLKKIEGIQMSVPNNLYIKNISNINMTYDFFDNTVLLMRKFREDMYRNIDKIPSNPEQLWTYFARPFQSHSQAIYSLNIILIPFGAVDMTKVLQNDQNFYYITLATIGNLIAREIAHHFDSNGIFYWNGTRDSAFAHLNDEFTKANYDSYINCHTHLLFQEPMNLLLPSSNKHIRMTIPQTTLNERLSDVMGVRLAHDTLARMESTSSKLLPWLDLDIHKLFYLAYAQA